MNIFLTGATGFLGGELLVVLSKRLDVDKIFCLVRANNEEEGQERIEKIFKLHDDYFDEKKIFPVLGNLIDDNLQSQLENNPNLQNIDVIIHSAANTSFSKIYDSLVEKVNIHGFNSILQWSKNLKSLKTFVYVGTATICGKGVTHCLVHEDDSPNVNSTHFVKYTFTKMTSEMMLRKELPEDKILVVRPSIIMGDSRELIPRSPVILWTLATLNLMRLVPVNPVAKLDIIPVDYAANSIVELLFANRHYTTYHVSSGEASMTDSKKVTDSIEGQFPDKPVFKFVQRALMSQMKNWSRNRLQPESELHNHIEYLDYWSNIFEDNSKLRILFAGLEPYIEFIELGQIFDNSRLLEDTNMGNSIPADIYINNSIKFLDKIDVFEGALDP